ncbi:DUF3073 domain-containing protein [Corynebacterium uberis]|uniref:DUF3073 domain-containing protein n=1 Tax=Corynebacterium TaxID=1716 RepID=UPI001D0A9A62|nr:MULTISPECIES: DUF3073 domain-containing protein [Corynebacterium]MCZ9310277.1 DUF3073 domain-containing protein [Corynebacterium sp. c6VSa_13]UDL73652.1 DUF3073 domain-containing protein [Corynebacterium uberis]UDL75468.1 DUF3073 domain-containing protein [Corynebacterium uberis]UDL77681.1 DUF3073 domain-containing protein [Corynebacterium uberis]UDL79965.1 DUF3073 domain-containing protein [Corynebacterium uberis]
MGRGRAKAKQTKVARRLKYSTPEMDLESLQRELAGQAPQRSYEAVSDPYAQYGSWDDEGDDTSR